MRDKKIGIPVFTGMAAFYKAINECRKKTMDDFKRSNPGALERNAAIFQENDGASRTFFPMRALTVVLSLTMAVFIGLSLHVWFSYQYLKTTRMHELRIQELCGVIAHFDEVLTMSARMGAATGDLLWEKRYREFEPQLDAAIKEALELAPETFMREATSKTETANIKLVAMEYQAFDLVRRGEANMAVALLFGKEYEAQKGIYKEGRFFKAVKEGD